MSVLVDTSGRIYDDFSGLLFLHTHREVSVLDNEIPEESGQFRFLHSPSLPNLKGSLGLVYYESRKRELEGRLVNECRLDERLKAKLEEST